MLCVVPNPDTCRNPGAHSFRCGGQSGHCPHASKHAHPEVFRGFLVILEVADDQILATRLDDKTELPFGSLSPVDVKNPDSFVEERVDILPSLFSREQLTQCGTLLQHGDVDLMPHLSRVLQYE